MDGRSTRKVMYPRSKEKLWIPQWVGLSSVTYGISQRIYDNFDRADNAALGGNWTEEDGDFQIVSNQASVTTVAATIMASNSVSIGSVNQYALITFSAGATGTSWNYCLILFRVTNNSTHCYAVRIYSESTSTRWGFDFSHYNNLTTHTGTVLENFTVAGAPTDGTKFGITLTGTGTDTTIRVWINPTGVIPDSAISWGSDTTPNVTFTADPGANAVDTGNYVGMGAYSTSNANTVKFNDFYAGSL